MDDIILDVLFNLLFADNMATWLRALKEWWRCALNPLIY